jgi:hypothetical protein
MAAALERMSKRARRGARLLAVAVAVAGALATGAATVVAPAAVMAPAAAAGEYHVYSCRTPSGEVAPADGWSGTHTGVETFTEDTCEKPGGALVAALYGHTTRTANTNAATWTFTAPAGEKLAGATLWRAGDAEGGDEGFAFYEFWFAGPGNGEEAGNTFGQCSGTSTCPAGRGIIGQPLAAENRLAVPGPDLGSQLSATASCFGESGFPCADETEDPNGYAAVVYLYAADLILEQTSPPSVADVSGELTSAPTVSGTSDVSFSASDAGSGVYEAVFSVDGRVVQSTVVDENGGRCKNVGQTTDGRAAFLYVQPCAASVNADVGFDTTAVANGAHHLVVSVIDAAGNAATVLDRNVTVENTPPPGGPNGTNASASAALAVAWKGARGARLASGFGRTETIVGRLTGAGGVPIGGAQVQVSSTADYAGASMTALASVLSEADGDFSLRIPAGSSSRTLRLSYSDRVGAPPVVTRTLTLSVHAGVRVRVAPRTASVGSSIHFSGRLLGGPVPSGGKLLVLEARSPGGRWLEFDVIRSNARGRFHASYRFKFPGPARYQFRAVCEAEADYPFATGASNVVGVFER